jgi:dTDP-glucose 4,6-dehydratase
MYTYLVKKILVLGCNSFSGSSFISMLSEKQFKIYGVSRSNINNKFNRFYKNKKKISFKKIDISKDLEKIIKYINKIKPTYIINFISESMVGESWKYPEDWYYLNSYILPTFYHKISDYKFIKKVIHFSTPEVYGSTKKNILENFNFQPSTPYGVSRVTADQTCQILFKHKKFPVIITRASNVYGEYQKLYRIIPKTIFAILNNKKIPLDGGGKSIRNFIHIDDVSKALIKIIHKGTVGQTYHISSSEFISIRTLIEKISKKWNKKLNDVCIISKERLGKDHTYYLSSKKLKKIGWFSTISLDMGINRVTQWINENFQTLKKEKIYYEHKKNIKQRP